MDEDKGFTLPFGYNLDCADDEVILRRADGSDVARFSAVGLDYFDVELAVWEDAD